MKIRPEQEMFIVQFIQACDGTGAQVKDEAALAEELAAFDMVDDWTEAVFADLEWEMLLEESMLFRKGPRGWSHTS